MSWPNWVTFGKISRWYRNGLPILSRLSTECWCVAVTTPGPRRKTDAQSQPRAVRDVGKHGARGCTWARRHHVSGEHTTYDTGAGQAVRRPPTDDRYGSGVRPCGSR